ncbi:MAG: type IV secretion system DNA-binding domain-containing protein, partial [Chloroflexi bacterium]|nr:type IV secretion system DNA-binding domain-containing protein [Chloroflexota bacterium]
MADRHAGATYGLKPADALKHLFVVGPTGVGKSTFLFWFALSAIRRGHGVLLLDPKGDLARSLLGAVPAGREADVVALDFADTDWPVGLNPLDVRDADEGDRVAMAVYSLLRELVRGEDFLWGTSMSQAFAYGFRTLAANPQIKPTMLDLERLFIDREWRESLMPNVSDPFLRSYWRNQVDRIS